VHGREPEGIFCSPARVTDPGKIFPQPLVNRSTEGPENFPQRCSR
jgi:hypothetical protein